MNDRHNHAVVIHGAGDVRVEDHPLPLRDVGEARVAVGSFRFNHNEFAQAVELIGNGLDLTSLLTDTVNVSSAPAAFEMAAAPASMRVQLDFAPR